VETNFQGHITRLDDSRRADENWDALPAGTVSMRNWRPSSPPEPYTDAKEGAEFLCIHPKTLMRLAREGSVPAYSFSEGTRRHWRFLISELDTWMRSKVNSNAHPVRSVSRGRRK
jgi:excisionase family DNA binding protein